MSVEENMKQDVAKTKTGRRIFVIAIATMFGSLFMPHDQAVATMAMKYIFPAVTAGIAFGIAIMAAIDMWNEARIRKTDNSVRGRRLFVIGIATMAGAILMPHGESVAEIAVRFVIPAVAAGIAFGIAIMAAIDMWTESKPAKSASLTENKE